MTPPDQDHSSFWTGVGAALAAAAAWLFRALKRQPRPDVPKGLSAADFLRITKHLDARTDEKLAESLRPVLQQLDTIITALSDVRSDVSGVRDEMRYANERMGRHESAIRILQQRVQATGGD